MIYLNDTAIALYKDLVICKNFIYQIVTALYNKRIQNSTITENNNKLILIGYIIQKSYCIFHSVDNIFKLVFA